MRATVELMKASARAGLTASVGDAYEALAASIVAKIELPALVVQVASGVVFILLTPGWLKMGWLHGKLAGVLVLLVLSHVEMFNARQIARLRKDRGDSATTEIDARKKRHARLGAVGTVAVVLVIGLVVFGR